MSKRLDKLLLEDILEAIDNILEYTSEISIERFLSDKKTKDAVVRNFEIIGEAANKISKDLKDKNPQLDWQGMIGFRNKLIILELIMMLCGILKLTIYLSLNKRSVL